MAYGVVRHSSGDRVEVPLAAADVRDRIQQSFRIRVVLAFQEHIVPGSELYNFPRIHHRYLVTHPRNDPKVMGD